MKDVFSISNLGKRMIVSPLQTGKFTRDGKRALFNTHLDNYRSLTDKKGQPLSVELAGPREKIFLILPTPERLSLPAAAFARVSTT